MRLPRLHVSLQTRLDVALAQLREFYQMPPSGKLELHHRPALANRTRDGDDYFPRSNDPAYLVWLPAEDHDIETRVRGPHGDLSDLAKIRKRKHVERKRKRPRRRLRSRGFDKTRTRKFSGQVVPRNR